MRETVDHHFETAAAPWQTRAKCAQEDPELFFSSDPRRAKYICRGCPVRLQCLREGMEFDTGVWGGLDPAERRGGHVEPPRDGRQTVPVTPAVEIRIVRMYVGNPKSSIRSVANTTGVAHESVRRILNQAGVTRSNAAKRGGPNAKGTRRPGTYRAAIIDLLAIGGMTNREISDRTRASVDYVREIKRELRHA